MAAMSSAAEAEIGALYINCRAAIPTRHTLTEMGHPPPPTPIQADNTTALGVVNNTIAPSGQMPWTCVSIGFAIVSRSSNFGIIGCLALITRATM